MMTLGQQINEVNSKGLSAPRQLTIDLSVAQVDLEVNMTGTSFYVFTSPDQTSYISVKVGRKDADAIDYVLYTGFRAPFTKLYITTPAGQTGTMIIIVAAEEKDVFEMIDNRSSISQGIIDVLIELQGNLTAKNPGQEIAIVYTNVASLILATNIDRKVFSIQVSKDNAAALFIGLGDITDSTHYIKKLQAGDSWDFYNYRGPVYAFNNSPPYIASGTSAYIGNYKLAGTYGGKPYYKHITINWYLWYDSTNSRWVTSQICGNITGPYWCTSTATITDSYTGYNGAFGTFIVTAGLLTNLIISVGEC
jgi:hypothetical protein